MEINAKSNMSRGNDNSRADKSARGDSKVSDYRDEAREKREYLENQARVQADALCHKLMDLGHDGLNEFEIRENICRELENMMSVETAMLLRQVGTNLYVGKKDGELVYSEVKDSGILTQLVDNRRIHIVNDVSKDREVVQELRSEFNLGKLHNIMILPFGQNVGKRGGVLILILLNKFVIGEDDKVKYEKYDEWSAPITNKVFLHTFTHALQFNALNNRVLQEIQDENFVFQTMNKVLT